MTPIRVLILEDQPIIGFGLKSNLEARGFEVVGPFVSITSARENSAPSDYDVAVLDINLGDGSDCAPFADELCAAGVPFVFASGYGSGPPLSDRFDDVECVVKPVDIDVLVGHLERLTDEPIG